MRSVGGFRAYWHGVKLRVVSTLSKENVCYTKVQKEIHFFAPAGDCCKAKTLDEFW